MPPGRSATGITGTSATTSTPRNNLESMRAFMTPSSSTLKIELPRTSNCQLANGPLQNSKSTNLPSFVGMRQGDLVKVSPNTSHYFPAHHTPTSLPRAAMNAKGGMVVPPRTYSPKLDLEDLPKIHAMLIKNQDEKIQLLEQWTQILQGHGDDLTGDDPEMIAAKLNLLSKRINELKAAVTARPGIPSSSGSVGATPVSSMPSPVPAPAAGAAARQRFLQSMIVEGNPPQPQPLHAQRQPEAGPSHRPRSPSPPEFDEQDVLEAEEWESSELVPASSPQPPQRTPRPQIRALDAMEEFGDLENSDIFSPPQSRAPLPAEDSSHNAMSPANPQYPGGLISSASAQKALVTPKVVKVDVKHPWTKEVQTKLRQVFKLANFRENQKAAIDATMAGEDVFVLMPTGGGKSLTYQLPAICSMGKTKGVTFVVSPLISLINDQTRHLIKRQIPAIAYTGDLTVADRNMAHEELSRPEPFTKVVYITPEMLIKGGRIRNIIENLLARHKLARFVIDEAHCVSQWGHDFRSDYLKLSELRDTYKGVPIMALTATAPNKVQADIIRVLKIGGCTILKQSFNRPNLHYEVRPKVKKVLAEIADFIGTQGSGASGIIYCSSREKCEVIAKELREQYKVPAWHYHAGMTKGDRRKVQEGWQEHKFEVIVATVAFGMGIDKPDVRYVIHHSLPRSLEGFYQETGRAGRDAKASTCILYYSYADSKTVFSMIDRDQNLDAAQKQRQRDSLKEVLRFCINKTDCRRKQVLRFFNEDFDPADCHQGCDVCLTHDSERYTTRDVLADAQKLLKVQDAFGLDERITQVNLVDCFRGMQGQANKALNLNPHFGIGKHWSRSEAERLVQALLLEGGIDEYYSANGAGWSNAYLRVGPNKDRIMNGQIKFEMAFREASPRKTAPAKASKKKDTSAAPRKAPPTLQMSAKRTRQEVLADQAKEFEGSDDEYQPTLTESRKRAKRASDVATPNRTDTKSPSELCYNELLSMTKKYAKNGAVLPSATLQTIAVMMPTNKTALAQIEGITAQQLKEYDTKILGITVKYQKTGASARAASISRSVSTPTAMSAAKRVAKTPTEVANELRTYKFTPITALRPVASTSATSGRLSLARTGSASGPRF